MIKGVILDFNGTLYLDHDINKKAWTDTFDSVKTPDSSLTYETFKKNRNGNDYQLSKAIFEAFKIEPTDQLINELSEKKEKEYRQLAIELNKNELIKGFEAFMAFLIENHIPYCIASMAPKSNFDFYMDYLHLDRWFNYDNVIYDNGKYDSKIPQYIDAAKIMGVDVRDCLVIEDTSNNIVAGIDQLKIENFIYVNSRNIPYNAKEVLQEIKDFTEIDYRIFNN